MPELHLKLWSFILTRFIPGVAVAALIYWIYHYIFTRPKNNRFKKQETLIKSLLVGDQIITVGGIVGTITELSENSVLVDVGNGVVLRIMRPAIGQRIEVESIPAEVDSWIDDE